jgi:hypothetical protein
LTCSEYRAAAAAEDEGFLQRSELGSSGGAGGCQPKLAEGWRVMWIWVAARRAAEMGAGEGARVGSGGGGG